MEYALFKSASLSTVFQNAVKAIHRGTDWNTDFEKTLATKLINQSLRKTDIAYYIANAIDEDMSKENRTIQNVEDENDTINYLVKAIKYATTN